MEEFKRNESLARSYLLGEMGEAEREEFEERFFLDPDFNEATRLIEDELVEDYAAGALTGDEREKFIRHYLTVPHQLRKLELTKALNEYADRNPSTSEGLPPARPRETFGGRLLRHWRGRNRFFRFATLAAAAGGLGLLTAVGVLLGQYISRAALLRRLKDLNAGNASAEVNRAHTVSLTLASDRDRARSGGQAPQELFVPRDTSLVRLTLASVPEGYDGFDVEVRALDGGKTLTVPSVRPLGEGAARHLSVNIPPELLAPGDYLLRLLVPDAPGRSREVANYFLRVSER